jgi:hypothetical protein
VPIVAVLNEILGKKEGFSISFENGPPAMIGTGKFQR